LLAVAIPLVLAHLLRPNDASPLGAPLGAPADGTAHSADARPEAYFLFVYQLLKYLEPYPAVIGALVVPIGVLLLLFLMPFWGRWKAGHALNVLCTVALLGGIVALTGIALWYDHNGKTDASKQYLAAIEQAKAKARRAVELAGSPTGIPPAGALAMLQSDPKTQGPILFRQHCLACHSHFDPGAEEASADRLVAEPSAASNLWRVGSRSWVAGILNPAALTGPHYFGNTKFVDGEMVNFVKENMGAALENLQGDELAALRRKIEDVTFAVSAEAQLAYQGDEKSEEVAARITAGREAITSGFECTSCHKFHENGELGSAPDLTGYASREWLQGIISDPAHERFYRDTNDRMPSFAPAGDDAARRQRLSPEEVDLIVSWLREVWYEPAAK
jgi:ubiquinol-cytochrome c reductase cytochrome b subunit